MRTVKYLGHVIREGVIGTDPVKIEAMVNYPIPRKLKMLRSFLWQGGISNSSVITRIISTADRSGAAQMAFCDDAGGSGGFHEA